MRCTLRREKCCTHRRRSAELSLPRLEAATRSPFFLVDFLAESRLVKFVMVLLTRRVVQSGSTRSDQ